MATWRLLDTGTRTAAENMALDRVLIDARAGGRIPNTLRFMQFDPPAVLVGHHQALGQEARLDWCQANGVDTNRRLTGGGAIYFDPPQIGWEIVASREDFGRVRMGELTRRICDAAAAGLRKLGVDARFRPRNDIEVDGKKISGTGGTCDEDVFLYQGTVLTDFDVEAMLLALRIPTEKLTEKGLETARDRVTCLRRELDELPADAVIKAALAEAFSEAFEVTLEAAGLTAWEEEHLVEELPEFEDPEWIHLVQAPDDGKEIFRAIHKQPGGLLRIHSLVDVDRSILRQVLITGDFFIDPRRAVADLEAWLRDTPFPKVRERVLAFFEDHEVDVVGLGAEDFWQAIRLSLEKVRYTELGLGSVDANALYPVNIPDGKTVEQVASEATVLLLPYCAKLPDCQFRFTQGCDECGLCTMGDAYRMARAKGLAAVSIIKYEHLKETLRRMGEQGVSSYIGLCCEAFFVKRNEAFHEAGIPGVLMDIDGKTCYQLGEEGKAYAGTFEAQADLKVPLLERFMDRVTERRGARFEVGPTPERDE